MPRPLDPARESAALEGRSLDAPQVRALRSKLIGEAGSPQAWDAASLTAAALAFRPDIAVAAAHVRRSDAAVTSAGARPNPVLTLTPEYVSNADPGTSSWAPSGLLDWRFETAGRRAHRIEAAQAQALAAHFALRGEVARAHAEISRALLAEELAAVNEQSLQLQVDAAAALASLWQRKVDAGAASLVQAAPARSQELNTRHALAEQRVARVEARSAAAAAVGVPAEEVARVTLRAPAEADLASLEALGHAEALDRALLSRSDVRAALAEYSAAEAALALEISRQYPDLILGPGYMWDQGLDRWSIGLSVEVPLLNRNEGPIAEAEAQRSESAARFMAVQTRAIAEVESALARRDELLAQRQSAHALAAERAQRAASVERALADGAASQADVLALRLEALRAAQLEVQTDAAWRRALVDLAAALEVLPFEAEVAESCRRELEAP